jgi:hypothetical protein
MTIYFMGGEMTQFIPSDTVSEETTGGSARNNTFVRAAARAQGTSSAYIESLSIAFPDTFYCHADIARTSGVVTTQYPLVFRTATTDVFRLAATNTTLQMQALISAVWTNIGSSVPVDLSNTAYQTIDLYVEGNDATGTATLYVAGTERATGVADLSAVTGLDVIRCYAGSSPQALSQVIVASEPTIGWRLLTRYPNGAGATGNWTGDYTGVDETVYSDADFINSTTADQVETFTQTGPAISGYVPRAVGVYVRARRGASGPQNLQLALRASGTDYFSGNKALSVGYDCYGHIWETNPATTADWLSGAIDALQPGVKSIA